MRILHVLNHTGQWNGNVHAAVDLACAQSNLGHDVAICSGGGSFDAVLAAQRVETFVVDQARRIPSIIAATVSLGRLIRRWRANLVHAHMVTSAVLAFPACKLSGIPLVTTVHNGFEKSAVLMGIGTRVIAVSAAVGRSMQGRGIPASRLRVVLNGTIGAARFHSQPGAPQPLRRPSILFVGGLHPRKGIADLLRAFAIAGRSIGDMHLYLVGEGPHLGQYKALADSLECAGRVTFCGAQADPRSYLRAADLFVLPSHADPAPLVISEAREAGCAIIGSDVDGIPELLEGGRAAVLVPPHDPERLAEAIVQIVRDPAVLAAWRRNSQINIDRMAVTRVARETIAIYEECLRPAARSGIQAAARRPS